MAKAANTTNDFEPEVVQELLGKIDGYHADLASERGTFMKTCRSIRESISNVYTEAKARGIPQKELRSLVKIRLNEAKNRRIYEELEADQQQTLSMLATAEGVKDLPLWRAAAMMGDANATAH
ncbi:GapR family DNA-binding domain-containing protein [Bradyrhizobium stylosanthis]|uniref:GapR family DNA-binding domain-containing protein n=1 Tax=Bradyrhizobium stylosanthis TaxID=1803665 RepID=UPI0007C4BDF0|nr:GapR family DNA-binding domain-containing protein [Bradyrhizobium stylosanthis]